MKRLEDYTPKILEAEGIKLYSFAEMPFRYYGFWPDKTLTREEMKALGEAVLEHSGANQRPELELQPVLYFWSWARVFPDLELGEEECFLLSVEHKYTKHGDNK